MADTPNEGYELRNEVQIFNIDIPRLASRESIDYIEKITQEIKENGTSNVPETVIDITDHIKMAYEKNDPTLAKAIRQNTLFNKLGIRSVYAINNFFDRDIHQRVCSYLTDIGIDVTQADLNKIMEICEQRDIERKKRAIGSFAQNGLLTLASVKKKNLALNSSSTPGDSSSSDLDVMLGTDNIRGYMLTSVDDTNDLFYGNNGFLTVVTERAEEEIDRASNLPTSEVENRVRNSMLILVRPSSLHLSKRTDNVNKEDVVLGDIPVSDFAYVLVHESNLLTTREAFMGTPIVVIGVGNKESNLYQFFNGPYNVPDYQGSVTKLLENESELWGHITRLPVDTYPQSN